MGEDEGLASFGNDNLDPQPSLFGHGFAPVLGWQTL